MIISSRQILCEISIFKNFIIIIFCLFSIRCFLCLKKPTYSENFILVLFWVRLRQLFSSRKWESSRETAFLVFDVDVVVVGGMIGCFCVASLFSFFLQFFWSAVTAQDGRFVAGKFKWKIFESASFLSCDRGVPILVSSFYREVCPSFESSAIEVLNRCSAIFEVMRPN